MIFGIGTDIASVDRFLNSKIHMDQFANKILTDFELIEYNNLTQNQEYYLAKHWAAKEAIAKAFGTGIAGDTKFKSIEIRHTTNGKPIVCFYDKLNELVNNLNARCHISISDDNNNVVSYSIVEIQIN